MHSILYIVLLGLLVSLRCRGCQVRLQLDSNQQWHFVQNHLVKLSRGSLYLTAPHDVTKRVTLQSDWKAAFKRARWYFRDGMVWSLHHRLHVLTVESEHVVLTRRTLPPRPSQKFAYSDGALRHVESGLYLTGWEDAPHVVLDVGGEGCEQSEVVHLQNEMWRFEGNLIRSVWNGNVITRKQGQTDITALPYDSKDKSLQQKWYWQNGFIRENAKSVLTILPSGRLVTSGPRFIPSQRFSLYEGFIENKPSKRVLYIPKNGNGLQLRQKHVIVR